MELHTLGEFGLIDLIDLPHPNPEAVLVGIGDDCAVLPYNDTMYQLASCDLLVEDIHFLRKKITPYQLGYKSVAVNLSDIAAMGGQPSHILLSVALPPDYTVAEWQELYRGIGDICKKYAVNLIGGDTTASPDKLTINVTVLGLVEKQNLHLRSAAKPGDAVFVTGTLGGSRAGLELLQDENIVFSDAERSSLLQSHCQPEPCCNEITVLNQVAGVHLHALNDVSDGLISECTEIADASGCALYLHTDNVPVNPYAAGLAKQIGTNALQWALTGGEDYQLAGTLDGAYAEEICKAYRIQTGKEITIVGYVTEGSGVYLENADGVCPAEKKGYNHFAHDDKQRHLHEAEDSMIQLLLSQNAELTQQLEAQRVYRHDLNNHLGCIQGLLECGEAEQAVQYLCHLLQSAPQIQTVRYHERTVLNILCSQKAMRANKSNIEFQFHSTEQEELLSCISDYDLCTLIGNLLDNGIEHAGEKDPYLYMDLFRDNAGNTVLRMENSCQTPPVLHNGIFLSHKADAASHGKGIEQIRRIVEQYHGSFAWHYDAEEERFITQCVFENC